MENRIMYFELKTGFQDDGPAWIGEASFSRTGTTVYFNNKAFKRAKGIGANHYDIETGEWYWISGVKENRQDRHWAGKGKIFIDRKVIEAYHELTDNYYLNKTRFEIIEIHEIRIRQDFVKIENQTKDE